jgi:hypothetical protein
MKKAIALGLLVAVFFAVFVMCKDLIGASVFYVAAISMAMFVVIGPFGDYFKSAIAMLVGVILGLISILALAGAMPLPPDNTIYVALVSGVALFILVLLSTTGLRIDAMFLGWAAYFAAVYPTYVADATQLTSLAVPAFVGVSVSLLVGLVLSLLIIKIAMAVNK